MLLLHGFFGISRLNALSRNQLSNFNNTKSKTVVEENDRCVFCVQNVGVFSCLILPIDAGKMETDFNLEGPIFRIDA